MVGCNSAQDEAEVPVLHSGERETFARSMEHKMAESSNREFSSALLGERAVDFLRRTDKIAYIRFISVYREFESVEALIDHVNVMVSSD